MYILLLTLSDLLHGVLYRRAGEQEAVAAAEGEKNFPAHAGAALDGLSLVQNHILPLDPVEVLHILHHLG